MRLLLLVTTVVIASPAYAKPVYLNCAIEGGKGGVDVTLDEERGTATTFDKTVPATFSTNEVKYTFDIGSVVIIWQTINRQTLALTSRSFVGKKDETKLGKCAIVTPANKF